MQIVAQMYLSGTLTKQQSVHSDRVNHLINCHITLLIATFICGVVGNSVTWFRKFLLHCIISYFTFLLITKCCCAAQSNIQSTTEALMSPEDSSWISASVHRPCLIPSVLWGEKHPWKYKWIGTDSAVHRHKNTSKCIIKEKRREKKSHAAFKKNKIFGDREVRIRSALRSKSHSYVLHIENIVSFPQSSRIVVSSTFFCNLYQCYNYNRKCVIRVVLYQSSVVSVE